MNKMIKTRLLTLVGPLIAIAIIGINTNPTPTYAEPSSANASVTVANTINLTLTGGDLVINNLTPGNAADSNSITATVTSNSPFGFHLAAATGTSTGTDSLVNTADSNFTFANLSTNKASLSNFSDNTWGYSYSTDGTNWISGDYGSAIAGYNGLPLDNNDSGATSTTLFNSDSYLGSKAVQFKIGAKSATTQAAGTYTNTINFYAVANTGPATIATAETMQEVEACPAYVPTEQVFTIKDSRDNQEYKVAKLKDGKCWMVENLNLAGGTALSAANTNVTSEYINNFTTSNNLTKDGNTIVLPTSSTTGFNTNNYSYVYNTGNKTSNCTSPGCYSYYSWDATTLGSGRTLATENTDAPYSICPKGWRLPTSGGNAWTGEDYEWMRGDLYKLGSSYGVNLQTSPSVNTTLFYNNAGPGTEPNFLLAGYYAWSSFGYGFANEHGFVWSSTSLNNTDSSRHLTFAADSINITDTFNRYCGFSVRCLFSGQ